jgi:hypothetical protein
LITICVAAFCIFGVVVYGSNKNMRQLVFDRIKAWKK